MAEANWAVMPTGGALDTNDLPRGVTNGFAVPNGGGNFVLGFRSAVASIGFGGFTVDLANFRGDGGALKGGSIRAAMKHYSAAATSAPIMGLINGTDPATATGYLLGLSHATAYNVALRKGVPFGGLNVAGSDILRASTGSFTDVGNGAAAWQHLRLDVLVNPHGETVLDVYTNDLTANAVTAPIWTAITGMDQYIDDAMGILTGSLPETDNFYFFFGHYTEAVGTVTLWDHLEIHRQTSP